jgi:hypothetical protein
MHAPNAATARSNATAAPPAGFRLQQRPGEPEHPQQDPSPDRPHDPFDPGRPQQPELPPVDPHNPTLPEPRVGDPASGDPPQIAG